MASKLKSTGRDSRVWQAAEKKQRDWKYAKTGVAHVPAKQPSPQQAPGKGTSLLVSSIPALPPSASLPTAS